MEKRGKEKKVYKITAEVKGIKTTAGNYKNKILAKRHKTRLEKRYPETAFKLTRASKDEKDPDTFTAVLGHIERGYL